MAKTTLTIDSPAFTMLKTAKSVNERADSYFKSIKRDLFDEQIKPLEKKIEKIDSELFDLQDFSLDTDKNRGKSRMTMEECKEQFTKIIEKQFEKTMIQLELKVKTESYNTLFGE